MNPFQDVFISYGRADSKQFAKHLNDRLVELGYTVWFDFEDIPLGVDYQKQIDDGIERADNFLFIISPHSINSPYCRLEIVHALRYKKRIIPLLHVEQIDRETWQQRNPQGTDEQWAEFTTAGKHSSFPNMPPEISKINWVNFREGVDDFETRLQELLELLERQKDYVLQHTILLQNALEWERNQRQNRYLLIGEERQKAEAWLATRFSESQPPCYPTDLHCEFITESIKNANNLMTEVFLSHVEADRTITEQVRRTLMRNGITTWTYRSDIELGTDLQTAIARGIEAADNILLMLSPAALRSESWCREIDLALELNKRIIIMQVAAVEDSQIPASLRNRQSIDLTDNQTEADQRQDEADLLRELKQNAAYHHDHKVLLAKALKWERQQRNPAILLRGYELQHALAWLKLVQQFPNHGPTPLQREFIAESERQPPGLALDVFISYSRADSDFARKLNDGLQRQGKRTWFDQESIASGTDFQQEIYRGIEASDHFLFILSPRSVQSPYCADEVEYAAKLNKRIVTVRYQAVDAANLHRELAKVQRVDFLARDRDFAANFKELIRTLDADPEHLRFHTRLLMQAIAWDERSRRESLLLRGAELTEAEQWLLQAAGKQPSPTALQGEYVSVSRRSAAGQQRRLIGILGSLLAVAVLAAGVAVKQSLVASANAETASQNEKEALEQRELAEQRRQDAEAAKAEAENRRAEAVKAQQEAEKQKERAFREQAKAEDALAQAQAAQVAEAKQRQRAEAEEAEARRQAEIAQQQEQIAKAQEAEANQQRDIAQVQTQLALVNQAKAKTQQQIALGRQLTAQAEVFQQRPDQTPRSTLLAIAAIRRLQDQLTSTAAAHKVLNQLQLIPLVPTRQFEQQGAAGSSLSPNGRYLVTGDATGPGLWDIEAAHHRSLPVHSIAALSFSPDSRYLSIHHGSDWTLWDIAANRSIPLPPVPGDIRGIHVSPDSQYVGIRQATGATLWHLGTQSQPVPLSEQPVDDLSFSPDSRYVALRSQTGATLWTIASRQSVPLSDQSVDGLSFSADSRYLGVYGESGVTVWTLSNHQPSHLSGNAINDLSFSPDSRYVRVKSNVGQGLWDIQTRQAVPLPETPVDDLSFSPDGRYVGIGSQGRAVVWERATNQRWQIPTPDVEGLFFSADGRYVGTIRAQTTGQVWSMGTRQEVTRVIHEGGIAQLSFSPSSRYVIAKGWDGKIQVSELQRQPSIAQAIDETGSRPLTFSPNGRYAATDQGDGKIQVWEIEGERVMAAISYGGKANQLTFSPDSRTLVMRGSNGTLVWDIEASRGWPLPEESITNLVFSPTGHYLATYGDDGTRVWHTQTHQPVSLPMEPVKELFFSPRDRIAILRGENTAAVWNLETSDVTPLPVNHIRNVVLSPGGRYAAIVSQADQWQLWDLSAQQLVPLPQQALQDLIWGPDDSTLGITTTTAPLLWNPQTRQPTQLPGNGAYRLRFSPDGRWVATEGDSGWALWDRQEQRPVPLPMQAVKTLVFSTSRSRTVASQYIGLVGDGGAMVWNVATQTGHSLPVDNLQSLELDPDGRTLAIRSQRDAIAWDLQRQQVILQITHNEGVVYGGFSATGQYFLTRGQRSAGAWLLDIEALISQACSRLNRNLTEQEWQQYVSDTEPYRAICPPNQLAQPDAISFTASQPMQSVAPQMLPIAARLSAPFAALPQ